MLYLLIKDLALLSDFKDTYKKFLNLKYFEEYKLDWKKKLKFIFITSAFAVLILIVLSNIVKMTQVSEKDFKTYRQGLTYLNQKDFENAYFNFSNVSKTSAIYEIALLRQALCADELLDTQTAAKKYRLFIEKYPESMFIQKAYYALAQNYFKEKEYSKAEKTFNDIKKNFKDSEYKTASNYYLGVIYKEKSKEIITPLGNEKEVEQKRIKAKEYFLEYLEEAPQGRFAMSCINEINSLVLPFNQKDYFIIGQTYFKNGALKQAYDTFNKSYMAASWGYLSLIYKKQGDYKKSREIFEFNYPKYSKNIDDKDLHTVIENYADICPDGTKQGLYKALDIAQTNDAKGEDYILYRLSKLENQEIANNFYTRIAKKFPEGKFASDAVANLFWQAYQNKHYQEAQRLGQIHIRDYQYTMAAPRVLFWMGKLSEKLGNRNEAKGFYQKVLEKYPDDYYAYRASKHLSYSHNDWNTKSSHRLPEKTQYIQFPIKHTSIPDDNVNLINTILKLNDYKLLGEIDKDNKAVQSWLNFKEGKYATSALLARDAISDYETKPEFSDSIYKLAYQLHYQDSINDYSKLYRLDPFLVTALIREESYFNPKAGSSAGAMGLMQLMPGTASFIASKNGIRYTGVSALYNPVKNIELGCAYLDYTKERLHEDNMLAVASYNGGPNIVKNWKNTLNYRNFDEFIENIPYPETRDYVKKVFRSYWVYLNVY